MYNITPFCVWGWGQRAHGRRQKVRDKLKASKLRKAKDLLKGLTKEEIRELKRTGKLKEMLGDAYDSDASFLRTTSGASRNSDGEKTGRSKKGKNYDSDGSKKRRNSKLTPREGGGGGAGSKGKKGGGKKGKGYDTSDSEDERAAREKESKKKKGGKGGGVGEEDEDGSEAATKSGSKGTLGTEGTLEEGDEDGDSDCSYRTTVSEGGTKYHVKMKRLRDVDGRVVGYGDPQPVPDEFRGASVLGREGSASGESDAGFHASFKPNGLGLPEDEMSAEAKTAAWKKKQRDKLSLDDLPKLGQGTANGPDGAEDDRVPSGFSDATTASDLVDMSKMTEEEKKQYLAQREVRRRQREDRRRAKYGDKYDEIMKKKQAKEEQEKLTAEEAQAERAQREEEERFQKQLDEENKMRRTSTTRTPGSLPQKKDKPKSMVTYEKALPRGLDAPIKKTDIRPLGPSHNDWLSKNDRRLSRDDSSLSTAKYPSYQRTKTSDDMGRGSKRRMPDRGELIDREKQRQLLAEEAKRNAQTKEFADDALLEIDASGKVSLKLGKKIDLSKISDDMLRKLGIDPNLSAQEKARLLKKLLGDDIEIMDGGQKIGLKTLSQYDLKEISDDQLADDPDLDVTTLTGLRKVNVMMRRGGMALKEHMMKVMEQSRLMDDTAYRNDLDEKGGSVDFMTHYRLVNPNNLEGYARAFVVEDGDLDTVIDYNESKTALEGIATIQHMTPKQLDYVFKVLNIHDATQVTFRMFAVITALCERVSSMDPLSKHLLEMCNLADIERKLDLYQNMFYHNRRGDRDGNYIKADSLKIELIAGGLNWKQQRYIMEKMEVNNFNEISFLDYMCYIPLFLSMHDNIVDNPLDMSDQKYTLPPRVRPPSTQRDMNPLGFPLNKKSSLLMRKQARDLMEGRLNIAGLRPETRDRLKRFSRLPPIKPFRRPSNTGSHTSEFSTEKTKTDFFLGQ